jgi:hypothetical protein
MVSGASTKFINEASVCTHVYIDKIRCTYSGGDLFIDVHYNTASGNIVKVGVTAYGKASDNNVTTPSNLVGVNDAPSGETVVATYEFATNTRNGALLIEDITVGSATIAAGSVTSITKSLSKAGYTPIAVAGFYGTNNGNIAVGDCYINASNVLNMYLINTGSSSKTPTMHAKILWQKD